MRTFISTVQPKWQQWLSGLTLVFAIGYLVVFVVLAGLRSIYPFELEWIEGAVIDEIRWIMQGKPIYSEPSIFYIPLSYNPFFFILSAALMKLVGIGFLAPRMISILATLGCFVLLFLIVSEDAGHPLPGVIAAGIYAASYRFTGAWMDLAKTDSLFLLLILSAFYISRKHPNYLGTVISGLLYVLAFYTKQTALPVILVLCILSLIESRGRTWLLGLTIALVGFLTFWGLYKISDGWYPFYTFETLVYHYRAPDIWWFWKSLIKHMLPAIIVGLLYPALTLSTKHQADKSRNLGQRHSWPDHFWQNLSLVIALVLTSWSIFFKVWTYNNDFMPACIGLGMLAGLGFGSVLGLVHQTSLYTRVSWLRAGVITLLILQFGVLIYNPLTQLPTRKDRAVAKQFIDRLRKLPGDVWVYNHGFMNYLAGKSTYFQSSALGDVIGGAAMPPNTDAYQRRMKVAEVFFQAVSEQRFNWVISDNLRTTWTPYYLRVGSMFDGSEGFYTITGVSTRPDILMVKNPVARGGKYPLMDPLFNTFYTEGWGEPQNWGRLVAGDRAVLQVALDQSHDYQIDVEVQPSCSQGQLTIRAITAGWNEQSIGKELFTSCEHQTLTFDLSENIILKGLNNLWFKFDGNTASANTGPGVGQSPNMPRVGFTSLTFIQK